MTLTEYAKQIDNAVAPAQFHAILKKLMSRLANETEYKKKLDLFEAQYWQKHQKDEDDKKISDKKLSMMWILTENGKVHNDLKLDLGTVNKLIKGLESLGYSANTELKHLKHLT